MKSADPLNIVLLTIDCWRGDHLGATGCSPSPTPHLDELAAEGTVFTQAITCGGWTRPAMMALFSSVYASRHHAGRVHQLSPDLPVLAELLQAYGYATAGLTANVVCGERAGFHRGFETFVDLKPLETLARQRWNRIRRIRGFGRVQWLLSYPLLHQVLRLLRIQFMAPEVSATAEQVSDQALAWLRRTDERPFFLWAHYMDIHWPYNLSRRPHTPGEIAQAWRDRRVYREVTRSRGRFDPGAARSSRWKTLYREELTTIDEQIGRVMAYLRAAGEWERTALVVTSDHGEEFYEHGTWAHSWNQLFDEGVHIPLIVRVPGINGGVVVREQVSMLDIAPTALAIGGVLKPGTMLGISLLPPAANQVSITAQPPPLRHSVIEMLGHRNSARFRMAVRTETHRYIYDVDAPHENQLYDRQADPEEKHNQYHKAHLTARHFDELRFAHMAPIVPDLLELRDGDDAFEGADREVADRLRELGYIS